MNDQAAVDELTGRELDAALAEAMGIKHWRVPAGIDYWQETGESVRNIPPAYSTSLDALSAGPEAKLIEAGMALDVVVGYGSDGIRATVAYQWRADARSVLDEIIGGATEAEARARAALAALRALADKEQA